MKKIQTKFILIFIGIVILPLFPIAWLVSGLVQEGYQIGVNERVEKALSEGVDFSRQLYQIRKIQLSETLTSILEAEDISPSKLLKTSDGFEKQLALPPHTLEWRFLTLQMYDATISQCLEINEDNNPGFVMNTSHVEKLSRSAGQKIVIAEREKNRFAAIEKRSENEQDFYFVLVGAMAEDFLENSNHTLAVRQLYHTLDLAFESVLASFQNTFLMIALLILVTAVAIAIWLSRRITRPLAALAEGTRELGQGNLDYRIPQQSGDEIGALVQQFNRMGDALKTSQERAIYLEKMAAWQEIARRLAHEIKNPLTPIQLTIQEMVDQYDGKDTEYGKLLTECHGIVSEEIENLRKLVREFSEFGRLPALQLAEGDVNSVIRDVAALYSHREIRLDLTEPVKSFSFDEDRVRRVLINLIENAVQADPDKQVINIQSALDGDLVKVSVTDQGDGIPPEMLEKIFQPYFSTKSNGIGLGLAITRKMVEEHDGKIEAVSEHGKGTTFTFWLSMTL